MRESGKVKKCDSCGKWIDTGYPLCKECYFYEEKQEMPEKPRVSGIKTPLQNQTVQSEMSRVIGNRDLRDSIENSIANARKSVYILSPYIERSYLFSDLEKLIKQKGTVRVVFREAKYGTKYERAIDNLIAMKAHIKYKENLHAKLIIVDEKIAIISSANLLSGSLLNNEELGIITSNREQVKDALSFFRCVYDNAKSEK
jgi:phosphatidylserine/phosphatidylglycerophosphate/cardiolipin synthase-like enzyme